MINDIDVMTWSDRTQESKNKEAKSLLDFYKNEIYYDEALQRAFDYGGAIFVPDGEYQFLKKITTSKEGVFLYGSENSKLIWNKYVKGNNVFEDVCVDVLHSDFSINGITLKYSDDETARILVRIRNIEKDISNFSFFNVNFLNGFYAVRAGFLPTQHNDTSPLIKNLIIERCNSVGRVSGKNCGHFLTSNGYNIKYMNNRSIGGLNTSSFGANFSSNIMIFGNIESGVARMTVANVEASAQLEDCENANSIISNNIFSHDIWISGSSGIHISNNRCHTLRVSVGNLQGFDVKKVIFDNNYCARIQIVKYGSYDVLETYSAIFKNNIIDPEYALKLNTDLPSRAITIQGGNYGRLIEFYSNKVISSASLYQASIVRGERLIYLANDNDFGVGNVLYSSEGGYVDESRTSNPVFGKWDRNPNAYIGFYLNSSPNITAIDTWLTINNIRIGRDLNKELAIDNTARIKFKRKGIYKINWIITLNSTDDAEFKLRLFDANKNIEIGRLIQEKISIISSLRVGEFNFNIDEGDEIILQTQSNKFNLNFSTDVLLTNFSIEKLE
ncbi:hypothetical protein [Acinetobacter proteolyticus]|uniref:Uncharacterized protein n=1 Tax=Acinetobacter proteolyticus TaxID=1776741 RepID=A0A2N0WGZ1_9GAMM|nr:hypothetical protein [Acinetobacter proteolyticus]PKF34687.1 hypothetical protein CW311_05820 [Acinetobacter proteolyticus]